MDSEELAARLEAGGWELTEGAADVVLVNTCGFIQAAKQESIDELLTAAESGAAVVAAGCLAERYGAGLADALPEAQVLSFDDYTDIAGRLDEVLEGRRWADPAPGRPAGDGVVAPLKIASGCGRRGWRKSCIAYRSQTRSSAARRRRRRACA